MLAGPHPHSLSLVGSAPATPSRRTALGAPAPREGRRRYPVLVRNTVPHGLRVAALAALLACSVSAQRADSPQSLGGDTPSSKLTTVLGDLVRAAQQALPTSQSTPRQTTPSPQQTTPSPQQTTPVSMDSMPKSAQDAMLARHLRINANNEVQVYVLMDAVTDDNLAQLTAAGAVVEISDAAHRRVQARVPVGRLQIVSALPMVNAVRLPTYGRRRIGAVTTEGDTILHADQVRQQFSVDGTGVRVGVISDGLKGVFATGCTACGGVDSGPISTLDLPAATGIRDSNGVLYSVSGGIVGRSFLANNDLEGLPPATPACGFKGAGAEGTALLEIVHDLAPGAHLTFANADTDLAFSQAVNFLAASNDIVLDDIGFYGEPYDGTSGVSSNTAAALNNNGYPIRAYYTSVGNDADEHYYGAYVDSGIDGTSFSGVANSGHVHLFRPTSDTTDVLGLGSQPYNLIQLPQNGEASIFLTWDDPFGRSSNNYDLYLVQRSTGKVVASSTNAQSGNQDPVETIDYVNQGAADFFQIVVQNVRNSAQPKNLNIFSFEPECASAGPLVLAPPRHERHNYNTAGHSVSAQSDSAGSPTSVVAVGAICSASAAASGSFSGGPADESCLDTSNSTIEFFSSRGPTLDGRVKPDITAIDGVSVTGAGSFPTPFFGTSASPAHMGGIAALILESAGCLLNRSANSVDPATGRATLRSLIFKNADALGGTTPNNVFGVGRVDAIAAARATVPTWSGSANLSFDGNSTFGAQLYPGQLGFSDPNQCALTALKWTGNCGSSPAATLACPVGTTAVSVAASNNGLGFSDSVDLQITVTDFATTTSPTAATISAGKSTNYVVTVTSAGGPFRSGVTLSCGNANLPPQTSCAFNPPTVIPGSGSAQSTLTISTTATSLVGPVPTDHFTPQSPGPARWFLWSNWSLLSLTDVWLLLAAMAMAIALAYAVAVSGATAANRFLYCMGPHPHAPRVGGSAAAFFTNGLAGLAAAVLVVSVAGETTARSASMMASGIALFPASLTFGSQTMSTTTPPQTVFVTNIGADTLNLGGISTTGDFAQVNSCNTTLASGATCQVSVTFTPTATGSRTGTLVFTDDASGSPQQLNLTGTGLATPATSGGTPTGTYNITVTGTSGTLSHFASVTLTVQ